VLPHKYFKAQCGQGIFWHFICIASIQNFSCYEFGIIKTYSCNMLKKDRTENQHGLALVCTFSVLYFVTIHKLFYKRVFWL